MRVTTRGETPNSTKNLIKGNLVEQGMRVTKDQSHKQKAINKRMSTIEEREIATELIL